MTSRSKSISRSEYGSGWTSVKMRFAITVAVLISMGLVSIVAQLFIGSESYSLKFIGGLIASFLGFFGHEVTDNNDF